MTMMERLKLIVDMAAIRSRILGDIWRMSPSAGRHQIHTGNQCPLKYISRENSWEKAEAEFGLGVGDETTGNEAGFTVFLKAADGDVLNDSNSPAYKLRQHMITTLQIGLLLLISLLPAPVMAQGAYSDPYKAPPIRQAPDSCQPYAPGGLTACGRTYTLAHRYGNVFINTGAAFHSYLVIATDEGQYARLTIKGVGAPVVLDVYVEAGARGPQDNGQPLYLNALTALDKFSGAISVKVELERPAEVSIAMHPDGPTFWTGVVMALETGRGSEEGK